MAALTYVQSTSAQISGAANLSLAYGSATTANSVLFAYVNGNFGNTYTVADNVNGSWTNAYTSGNLAGQVFQIWFFNNGTAGTVTVTATLTAGGVYTYMGLAEYTGQAHSGSLVDAYSPAVGGASPQTMGPITSTQTNEGLIVLGWCTPNTTSTGSAGYTMQQNGNNAQGFVLADNQTAAAIPGSFSFTLTDPGNNTYGNLLAVRSTSSLPPTGGGGDLGPGYDFKFRL